uniref:Uncharacterized protein n=1 Tax=Avena sativa TaxID=4498 RepID=A0ACD5UWE6_AVESA
MMSGDTQEGCESSETADARGAESIALVMGHHLYGDVLESVVECLPAADLAASAVVSREWLRAVRCVLRRRPRRLPWLVVHLVGRRHRQTTAYDPHSGSWLTVCSAPHGGTLSTLRHVISGRGDRLCALSLSGLDIAGGSLGRSAWMELKAPSVWRVDPVLAVVGERVVVLGGACELALAEGENAAAVEVHDEGGGSWSTCDPMPSALRESASATWLSAAATDERVYLTERRSGWASWFNPSKHSWGPTRRLTPDSCVSTWAIAPAAHAGAERLVLFGAKRQGQGVVIQAWEVDGDALDVSPSSTSDAMPSEMSAILFPRSDDDHDDVETWSSIRIRVCGNATGGYVYNAAEPANGAVLYELRQAGHGGSLVERWERVPCAPSLHAQPLGRVIIACSQVGLDQLPGGLRPLGSQLKS